MTLLTETGFLQSESGIPSLLQETRVGGHIGSTDYPQTRLERSVLSTRVWGKQPLFFYGIPNLRTVHTCVGEAEGFTVPKRRGKYCPHVCGGSILCDPYGERHDVLSTRVWGKHHKRFDLRVP